MKKQLLTIFILVFNFGFSQTKIEIDSLLNKISEKENSKEIRNTVEAKKFAEYGWKLLPKLAEFFNDQTETNVSSECVNRKLTKGEIAIIVSDLIEGMPYAKITGVQNCTLTFCEENPNLIEYYLDFIKSDGIENFQKKYNLWLISDERIEWRPLFDSKTKKERKKIAKEKKKIRLESKKKLLVTGVWQDCEFCSKFTFISRKKFYL